MTITTIDAKIRPMILQDLEAIFLIDHRIRTEGKPITYANITTEHIFNIDRHVAHLTRPLSYIDLITGDVSELLDFGFVANVGEHVCGFIVGRVGCVGETVSKIGSILILGVHPDYWRQSVATRLINALIDKFRSAGVKTIRIEVDYLDKSMLGFVERMGFGVGHHIIYTRTL